METAPVLMEIELLRDCPGVPAGKHVVRYITDAGGALRCAHSGGDIVSLPDSSYRILHAWRGPEDCADGAERHTDRGR